MNQAQQRKKTVLVIDDEFLILQTLREALELDGFSVITAQNGRDGLRALQQKPHPALILLDMMMPIMGGRAFLDRLADDLSMADIPVLVVSAEASDTMTLGATLCIRKPPDLDLLLEMVQHYTSRRPVDC